MKKVIGLLIALLLVPQVALGVDINTLTEAYKEYYAARTEVINKLTVLVSAPDGMALQAYEKSLSDALVRMDEIEVDRCFLPWYSIARAEFEIQVEVIALSKTPEGQSPKGTEILNAMHTTAFNIKHLNETLFVQAREECVEKETGTSGQATQETGYQG